jgi:hypothetical protein
MRDIRFEPRLELIQRSANLGSRIQFHLPTVFI